MSTTILEEIGNKIGSSNGIGGDLSGALSEVPYNPNRPLTYGEGSQMIPLTAQTTQQETPKQEISDKSEKKESKKDKTTVLNIQAPALSDLTPSMIPHTMQGGATNEMTQAILMSLLRG